MIRLNPHREPAWFDLLPGVRVKVAPVTSALMLAARKDAAVREAVLTSNDGEIEVAIGKALAQVAILEWEGVVDADDKPAPVTPENVGLLLDVWEVWIAWSAKVLFTFVAMSAEKNVSAPLPSGSSAGAGNTAGPVKASATTAPAA